MIITESVFVPEIYLQFTPEEVASSDVTMSMDSDVFTCNCTIVLIEGSCMDMSAL